jgi:hypothetical protein
MSDERQVRLELRFWFYELFSKIDLGQSERIVKLIYSKNVVIRDNLIPFEDCLSILKPAVWKLGFNKRLVGAFRILDFSPEQMTQLYNVLLSVFSERLLKTLSFHKAEDLVTDMSFFLSERLKAMDCNHRWIYSVIKHQGDIVEEAVSLDQLRKLAKKRPASRFWRKIGKRKDTTGWFRDRWRDVKGHLCQTLDINQFILDENNS